MKKLFLTLYCFTFALSTTSIFANPCKDVAHACMKAGYYKGGNATGKGLVVNCMLPVTAKKMTLPNTNFSDQTLSSCHSMIAQKMEQQVGH